MAVVGAKIRGQLNRLKVFRFVKQHMTETGDCPFATVVANATGLHPTAVADHMRALYRAEGLPFPITDGEARKQQGQTKGHETQSLRAQECELDVVEQLAEVGCV